LHVQRFRHTLGHLFVRILHPPETLFRVDVYKYD
jgi:hypothetical protein